MNHLPENNLWVIIPTYNRADDLLACLESLIKAGINKRQIIVVDNNSQDDTLTKLHKEFPEIVLIALQENAGATGASNIGFQHALSQNADYVLRLDSDTIVAPDFAEILLEKIAEDPQIGVVAPKIYYYEPADEIWYAGADTHPFHFGTINGHRHQKDAPENSRSREVDYVWGAAMLIRGEVLQKTGGFDTDFFVYYEEVDLCQRIQKLDYILVFVPKAHVWHKVGSAANNAFTAFHWNRSKMLLYRKHARNKFHLFMLISYSFAYAISDAVICFLKLRKHSGNRGPFRDTIKGLISGIKLSLSTIEENS